MIKLVYCLRRKPGMTLGGVLDSTGARCTRRSSPSAPRCSASSATSRCARSTTPRSTPRCRRATTAHPSRSTAWPSCGSTTPRSDGPQSPEAAKAGQELLDDERNFIDLARSPIWFANEWQVV